MDANTLLKEISSRFSERLDSEVMVNGKPIGPIDYLEDDNTIRIYSDQPGEEQEEESSPEPWMEAEAEDEGEDVIPEQYDELDEDEMQNIAEALNDANGENS